MLEARDINKSYESGIKQLNVLKGITLHIKKGEFISIFGPSGAGKSTLLHIMGGLDSPTKGSVLLEGADIYQMKEGQRARIRNTKIGFVFQFYNLLSEFSALENVMMPALIRKTQARKDTRTQAEALLKLVGLANRMSHRPPQLSGGEQQRVAVARAVMNEPSLLLCDEPTGNLDSATGKDIIELLGALNKEKNTTVAVVTHEEHIAKMADRIFYIKDGRLQ